MSLISVLPLVPPTGVLVPRRRRRGPGRSAVGERRRWQLRFKVAVHRKRLQLCWLLNFGCTSGPVHFKHLLVNLRQLNIVFNFGHFLVHWRMFWLLKLALRVFPGVSVHRGVQRLVLAGLGRLRQRTVEFIADFFTQQFCVLARDRSLLWTSQVGRMYLHHCYSLICSCFIVLFCAMRFTVFAR